MDSSLAHWSVEKTADCSEYSMEQMMDYRWVARKALLTAVTSDVVLVHYWVARKALLTAVTSDVV